jgi:hypothetical protein
MKTYTIPPCTFCLFLAVLFLSACQPVRPEPQSSTQAASCSDEEKIALFKEAVANNFDKANFPAVVAFYAEDGILRVDMPPSLDAATGTYTVTGQVEGKGTAQLMDMTVGSYETGVKMKVDQVKIENGLLIAAMTGTGAWYVDMGMPTDTAHPIFTVKFNADCKAAEFIVTYPPEFLQTLKPQ